MFVLNCHITIGAFVFRTVHEVQVRKSIHSYVDTATIKLPASARLKLSTQTTASQVDTAKQFNEGDIVVIRLGYGEDMQEEFRGFVSRIDFAMPCVVECEGYSWLLREKSFTKVWKNPTAKDVLEFVTAGTSIKLSQDIPNTVLTGKVALNNETALQAFDQLKKDGAQTIYFIGDTLYSGLDYSAQLDKAVKYKLGFNTIKDSELKYRRAEDVKVQIKVQFKDKKGKVHFKLFGKAGGVFQTKTYGLELDMDALEAKANKEAQNLRYEGYEGKVSTFLVPFAQHGWKAVIIDEKYPERSGDYILEGTEVVFGRSGGRRIIQVGKKVNRQ